MTYGLLIGWGGGGAYFQGECQEKILLCKWGHYMKNKNIVGVFCQLYLISKKGLNAKMRKKCKKNYQTLKKFSSLVSLTRHFTKFIFLEQLTATPQFNIQNIFFFFFFFLSSHHDTHPLLHLYHFRKKYNYILANNGIKSESSRVIFSFFRLHPVGQTCTPANFVTI